MYCTLILCFLNADSITRTSVNLKPGNTIEINSLKMITEKQIFDVLNKYQSNGCILQNEKCIDPMDFHKIVNEMIDLIKLELKLDSALALESTESLTDFIISNAASEFSEKLQRCATYSTIHFAFVQGAKFILNKQKQTECSECSTAKSVEQ